MFFFFFFGIYVRVRTTRTVINTTKSYAVGPPIYLMDNKKGGFHGALITVCRGARGDAAFLVLKLKPV